MGYSSILVARDHLYALSHRLVDSFGRIDPMTHNTMKEGNSLFNDALNTFYLMLYGKGPLR